ncbi:MAG: hypothetical protein IKC09_02920 [Oscillospiraceae bacterium]|nr:hypothetical protein [Oscillospiraceae bacterium]
MLDLLYASCSPMLWVITVLELVFTALLFSRYFKTKNLIYLLSGLICVGLTYDALILALGSFMVEGPLLMGLSRMRYILHGGLIPLIFLICAYALDFKGLWMKAAWVFTGVLMVLGIADGIVRTIGVETVAGICRYASVSAPVWADIVNGALTFGTVIPMMVAGIFVWIRQKTPFLFLSAFLMFLFSGLGAACLELMFYISMYGELLMALFLYLYALKKDKMA